MELPREEEGVGGFRDRSGLSAPFLRSPPRGDKAMNPCPVGQVTAFRFDELGDQFRRYWGFAVSDFVSCFQLDSRLADV